MKILQVTDLFKNITVKIPFPDGETFHTYQLILLDTGKELVVGRVLTFDSDMKNPNLDKDYSFKRHLSRKELDKWKETVDGSFAKVIKSRELAEKNKLDMHFFQAREDFDGKFVSLFFVSKGKVDFRELLKDLSREFKKRIYLQRVSANDRLKMIGCYDISGRYNVNDFAKFFRDRPTMDVVRDQGIMIRNNKRIFDISGKIKGSLVYEVELYREMRRYLPHIKQQVKVGDRTGRVKGLNILDSIVKIEFEPFMTEAFHVNDVEYSNKKPLPEKEEIDFTAEIDMEGVGI